MERLLVYCHYLLLRLLSPGAAVAGWNSMNREEKLSPTLGRVEGKWNHTVTTLWCEHQADIFATSSLPSLSWMLLSMCRDYCVFSTVVAAWDPLISVGNIADEVHRGKKV